ncbi:MAG: heme exporter protein CcmD [Pseudomonadota bacterium]
MIPNFEYAAFVWSSYLIFSLVIAWQFLQPWFKRKQLARQIAEQLEELQAAEQLQQQTRGEQPS